MSQWDWIPSGCNIHLQNWVVYVVDEGKYSIHGTYGVYEWNDNPSHTVRSTDIAIENNDLQ